MSIWIHFGNFKNRYIYTSTKKYDYINNSLPVDSCILTHTDTYLIMKIWYETLFSARKSVRFCFTIYIIIDGLCRVLVYMHPMIAMLETSPKSNKWRLRIPLNHILYLIDQSFHKIILYVPIQLIFLFLYSRSRRFTYAVYNFSTEAENKNYVIKIYLKLHRLTVLI